MLFIVPEPKTGPAAQARAAEQHGQPGYKVELDLDDAPFLEDEVKPAAPPPPKKKEEPHPKPVMEPPKPSPTWKEKLLQKIAPLLANKKKLMIAGGAAAGLLVAAIAVNVLLSDKEPEPAPVSSEPKRITVSTEPQEPEAAAPAPQMVSFDPFLVERRGSEGELRFLRIQFAIPVENDDQVLYANLLGKRVTIRDAVYYYLSHKPLTLLQDEQTKNDLKTDIVSVINEHISPAKVKELFLEEYLVTKP